MDFQFSDEQRMVRDLARGILEKEMTVARVKAASAQEEWFDRALWSTCAEAGLLGLVVPEGLGGMGFGIGEACVFLEEVGRALAPIPALATVVLGGLAIAQHGSEAQQRQWLAPLAGGTVLLTGAFADGPEHLGASARQDGTSWIIDGTLHFVPAVHLAQRVVVPAATPGGAGLFLIDPQAKGVALARQTTSSGEPLFTVELSGVRAGADALLPGSGAGGAEAIQRLYHCAVLATCAMQVGVSAKMIELTANYVREREQFGVPIGSFQAVQHRLADGYIDLEAMRWCLWRAAWELAEGLPAAREVAVAKVWAAEGSARIATATMHLHGGIGVDIDYPIHRYFLWSKTLELSLGAAAAHLAWLGAEMARSGPPQDTAG